MVHTPFVRNVPPESLYESDAMIDVQGRLAYAADKQLFVVVTADSGCGKSTVIRKFDASLPKEDYILLYLSDARLTPLWLYKGMLNQLGIEPKHFRIDAKRQFQKEIEIIRGVQHKKVVCILDEAHLLDKETLEEFRFFLNTKIDSESPMALILVGQTELRTSKLNLQRYAAIPSPGSTHGVRIRLAKIRRPSISVRRLAGKCLKA
jgi:type II secretory pathway predicted ATPase ExeA